MSHIIELFTFFEKTQKLRLKCLIVCKNSDEGLADPGSITPSAMVPTSNAFPLEMLSAVNDNSNPSDSNDKTCGVHGNWPDFIQLGAV
jgi:hypothetical protein